MLAGICITSSYLADQCYDYNPLTLMLVVLMAYILQKIASDEKKNANVLRFLALGAICGLELFLKQNIGIVLPFFLIICILLLAYLQQYDIKNLIKRFLLIVFGFLLGVLPGVIYLSYNNIWREFISCITNAVDAKTSNSNFLLVALKNFFDFDALIVALIIISTILLFIRPYKRGERTLKILLSCSLLLTIFRVFQDNIIGFFTGLSVQNNIILAILAIIALIFFKKLYTIFGKKGTIYLNVYNCIILCLLVFGMFLVLNLTGIHAEWLYYGISFSTLKSKLLYIILYLILIFWLYMIYDIFVNKKNSYYYLLFPSIILLLFMGVSFISARLEELYAVIIMPVFICILIENVINKNQIKNLIIYGSCICLCLICLLEKLFIPYDWHSWTMQSVLPSVNKTRAINIKGLNGFLIADSDATSYENIIQEILENSEDNDTLYQFPNVLLFNVLTERETIYAAVPYFDVCPDNLAEESAEYLENNMPELVLYSELNEGRWSIHEQLFRNGNLSGQRKIQDFYNNIVKANYRLLGQYDNRSGDPLCLWKKTAYINGQVNNEVEIKNNFQIEETVEFGKNEIENFCIYSTMDLTNRYIHITIFDSTAKKEIFDDDVQFSSFQMNYNEANLGHIEVDTDHEYLINIQSMFDMDNMPITVGVTDAEAQLDIEKNINYVFD